MTKKKSVIDVTQGITAFTHPAECLCDLVTAYTDYLKVTEEEQTKRREIDAWEKTTIAQIKAQRGLLIEYLERSFDERSQNFISLFSLIDRAVASGNNDQLALALHSITELANSNPFEELANLASLQADLDNPDHNWIF